MLKRGLMIVVFLVLLSSSVCAWSIMSTTTVYEGSSTLFKVLINNTQPGATVITQLIANTPGVTITDVPAINGWDSANTATSVSWVNGTVETNVESATFRLRATAPAVVADTNTVFIITKINGTGFNASENHTITIRNDTTPPAILNIDPANGSSIVLTNANKTITAQINESESQIGTVNYTYCKCAANSTNCTANSTTISLTCTGSTCNGTIDVSSFNEGDYLCYTLTASNNVGGVSIQAGKVYVAGEPPVIFDLGPANGAIYLESDTITISANATDNSSVDTVYANLTYPNGTNTRLNLIKAGTTDKYSIQFNPPAIYGWYNITIFANDTNGNVNNSAVYQFKIVPDYNFTLALNPATVKQGRTTKISGTILLSNGSAVPENNITIVITGTTVAALANGIFSHTFTAPQSIGNHNVVVNVYAANGYNYSDSIILKVTSAATTGGGGAGWGWNGADGDDYLGYSSGIEASSEDASVAEAPEEIKDSDNKPKTPEPEPEATPEEVIDDILNQPEAGNQITGSAVGTGTATTALALILLVLGLTTLAYSNTRIRNHIRTFAKEKVGSKFKSKKKEDAGFSDKEWEEYFKRLKED